MGGSEFGGLNEATERLFAYHQATKHTYDSVRAGAHYLDWKNQPNPFRTYEGAPSILLSPEPGFPDIGTFAAMAALADGRPVLENQIVLDEITISRLLWHAMAVSAWKKVPRSGDRYSLRVNPSSGNLHPTETYFALRGVTGLDDGLYHYRADRHALELRNAGDCTHELSRALASPAFAESPLIVALTSIFWREAWKYRDRAYRYCCHDLGHAMISLLLSARALGLSGSAIAHFADRGLADTLGLIGPKRADEGAELDEAPMIFLMFQAPGFPDQSLPAQTLAEQTRVAQSAFAESTAAQSASRQSVEQFPAPATVPSLPRSAQMGGSFAGTPNELSPQEIPYELLLGMHRSTLLPDPPGPLPVPFAETGAAELLASSTIASLKITGYQPAVSTFVRRPQPARDAPLGEVARRRRSALDFDAASAPMDREDVEELLDFATRDWPADWRGNIPGERSPRARGADFVSLYLYVHRVRNCEPGVYRWHTRGGILEQLHRGNVERVAAYLSLEQALAGNSCFTISMIADLARAARTFGNRGYRYAHFEAGAIGQRLYLGAEALHWNATGIGAFYDDDVHRYLGFLEEGEASVQASLHAAEQVALVMLGSPAGRRAAASQRNDALPAAAIAGANIDSTMLPRQVIYHFAVGRAVPDPRLEA
jgi:SagB-type dehydrogenase family enzyme